MKAFTSTATADARDEISFEVVKYPDNGMITMFDRESGEFRYTPSKDHTGKDSFEYVVRDKYGNNAHTHTYFVKDYIEK